MQKKTINRYLIFAHYQYYPQGGMDDCIGKANTLKNARKLFINFLPKDGSYDYDYMYIYDLLEDKRVWDLDKESII